MSNVVQALAIRRVAADHDEQQRDATQARQPAGLPPFLPAHASDQNRRFLSRPCRERRSIAGMVFAVPVSI